MSPDHHRAHLQIAPAKAYLNLPSTEEIRSTIHERDHDGHPPLPESSWLSFLSLSTFSCKASCLSREALLWRLR